MAPPADNTPLLMDLHAGLAVAQNQQSEINRRLGLLETQIDNLPDGGRIKAIEDQLAERKSWSTWFLQIVGQAAILGALAALAKVSGIEVPL